MNFDELKTTWQKEMNMTTPAHTAIVQAQKTDSQMRRAVIIEIFASVLLLGMCLRTLLSGTPMNLLTMTSHIIMIGMSLFIPYRLLMARRSARNNDWTLRSNIEREIDKLGKQKILLDTVISWYIAPLMFAVFIGSWGGHAQVTGSYVPDPPLLFYWGAVVVMTVMLVIWNRRAARRNLQPALDRLQELRRQLDEP